MAEFGFALRHIRNTVLVRRQSWDEGLFISKPSGLLDGVYKPHLCLVDTNHPDALASHWLPSYDDLMAEDWEAIAQKRDFGSIENY